jgi:hypothetical protein
MKMNPNFRFGKYVLWLTALCLCIVLCFYYDFQLFVLLLLFPSMKDLLGPDYKGWYESDREISNRTLIIGIMVCLVVLWVGGIILAHYISPQYHTPKYLAWVAGGVLWLVHVQPGYRWWRAQKRKADA